MITRSLAAWLLAIGLLTSSAYAHGGVDVVDNRCVLQVGPDIMFFTASQPHCFFKGLRYAKDTCKTQARKPLRATKKACKIVPILAHLS
jgi:hypothetical protein